jgi:hypothetical protein
MARSIQSPLTRGFRFVPRLLTVGHDAEADPRQVVRLVF